MNKKILVSLSVIGAVAAIVIGGTVAFFSDTETSSNNTFTAGSIDLKVDSVAHFNSMICTCTAVGACTWQLEPNFFPDSSHYPQPGTPCTGTWTLTDLTSQKFFDFADLKPGDEGENTISLHVDNNDAWACMTITTTRNADMTCTEPELAADADPNCAVLDLGNPATNWNGELAQALTGKIWADICVGSTGNYPGAVPGDNIHQPGCDKIIGNDIASYLGGVVILPLADMNGNVFTGEAGPLTGAQTYYIGMSWSLPGAATGNAVQSDSYVADISFKTEQARHNGGFECISQYLPDQD